MARDVQLAGRLAEGPLDEHHAPLPARGELGGAGELPRELEILIHNRLIQVTGR
jgi:hypothetical protein